MSNERLSTKILGAGQAQAITFLPGFTGSHRMWNRDFHALSTRYTLIFLDLLGFGDSPKPDIDYTIDDHLDAINTTLESLDIQTTHVVGHSIGCSLALASAHRFPDRVMKMVLLALPYYRSEQEARILIQQSSLFNRLLALDTPLARVVCTIMCYLRPLLMRIVPKIVHDVPDVVAQDALKHTWRSYSRTMQNVVFRAQTLEWLRTGTHPTLIIQGIHDRIAPISNVEQAIDHLPNVQLIRLEAGHRLVFTHSAEIARVIAEFLQPGNVTSRDELQLRARSATASVPPPPSETRDEQ
jgi:pimeloyl-ACP methyl ester carboxylesterase